MQKYLSIYNPLKKKYVKTKSVEGKKIIKKYLQKGNGEGDGAGSDDVSIDTEDNLFEKIMARFNIPLQKEWYEDCNKDCIVDDNVYKIPKYKIITPEDMTNELLESVRTTLDLPYTWSNQYVIKKMCSLEDKIIYLGDYHSSLHSLLQTLNELVDSNVIIDSSLIIKDNIKIIFTGDLVDRGPYGLEILYIVFTLIVKNPGKIVLLKGNHEDISTYSRYGFNTELEHSGLSVSVIGQIRKLLEDLPEACYVSSEGLDYWYLFCHGGIDKKTMINLDRSTGKTMVLNFLEDPTQNRMSYNTPESGYLWTDFDFDCSDSNIHFSGRGYGIYKYGPESTKRILDYHNIKSVISGHQDFTNIGIMPKRNYERFMRRLPVDDVYGGSRCAERGKTKLLTLPPLGEEDIFTDDLLNMNHILAITISSATVPKKVKNITFGVLLLSHERTIIHRAKYDE